MRSFSVLIVGGGHAGVAVAAQLRKANYPDSIGILESQEHMPYERPPLSKGYMTGEVGDQDLLLRQNGYWEQGSAELILGATVAALDSVAHIVTLESGERLGYGSLVWATGAAARQLPVPGAECGNVVSVRTLDDARRLCALASEARSAVLIGGGYIGLETASTLSKLGLQVTVLEAADRLLARVAGPALAEYLRQMHESHGVRVVLDAQVEGLEARNDRVSAVQLSSGERFDADLVVIGVGVVPSIGLLEQAGAEIGNGVFVDEECRTSLPDVYAVGDVAAQENAYFLGGERFRLESVPNVTEHAKFVAASILGKPIPARGVPWFWSNQYDIKLQTAGILAGFDQEVVRENSGGTLVVGYFREGRLLAADTIGAPQDFNAVKLLLGRGIPISPTEFADRQIPLAARTKTAQVAR